MSAPSTPADLLDLKMMPAWVNEPAERTDYSHYQGEEEQPPRRDGRRPQHDREQRPRGPRPQGRRDDRRDDRKRPPEGRRLERPPQRFERREAPAPLPQVGVRFLPHAGAFESVTAQIKGSPIAYSVFALARLFLDKPERYDVRLIAAEGAVLHQLGEHGPVAVDSRILEGGAFAAVRDEFYTIEETQSEPIKGNFTNVARDRASGTLLGPTNHHSYQPQLRGLYEQRYSRRMSFQDFQRQIEIVSDPAVVEQWKEQARSVTTYLAKDTEPPVTFNSVADAERHFRQTHLPTLLRNAAEVTVSGVVSRQLPDRGLGRVIEEGWAAEIRSPSRMMQELAGGLRQAGLNIFRHRRGMLFVSPIRTRIFGHERAGVSASINAILQKVTETPGINRKQLAEQLTPKAEVADLDRAKRTLVSDLHWLVSEGYVIEFNDGTLDLPRPKAPPTAAAGQQQQRSSETAERQSVVPATDLQRPENAASDAQAILVEEATTPVVEQSQVAAPPPEPQAVPADSLPVQEEEQIGMSVEQSIEPNETTDDVAPADAVPIETSQPKVADEAKPDANRKPLPEVAVPSPS